MNALRKVLNKVVETRFIFPPSATGGEPKDSWKDPGTHYWIDADGVFTRTKRGIVSRKPISYAKFRISRTSGRTIIDCGFIKECVYMRLSDEEKKQYKRTVCCGYRRSPSGLTNGRWIDLDDAINFNLNQNQSLPD